MTSTYRRCGNEICRDIDITEDVDRIALEISTMSLDLEDAIDQAYERLWEILPDEKLTNKITKRIIDKILEEVARYRDERVRCGMV